ncbi:hypothetical protein HN681_02995 [archaeon]|jgi:hypothetical protein|nr:hypothetical protein [archaeon]MBT3731227.1 hypothetical protein [archaeon]MBT4670019.1 hypothetical protein [archaeon]MBT5287779.1 hypothetical protein [archaeon]MBT7052784.1 hypothetical protein [archaeon]
MTTRFILDNQLKARSKVIREILELTKKAAYPSKDATHLASFMDACFYVMEEGKRKVIKQELKEKEKVHKKELLKVKKKEEEALMLSLEAEAPEPEALEIEAPKKEEEEGLPLLDLSEDDTSNLAKREYVLKIYGSPVGVLVDKDESEKYIYNVVEPVMDKIILEKAKASYGKELERKNELFENITHMKKIAENSAKKAKMKFNDMMVQKTKYYLSRDIIGAGSFDALLFDEKVKEIIYSGENKKIRVNYDNLGEMDTNVLVKDNKEVNNLIKKVSFATGKPVNMKSPILSVNFQGLKFDGVMGLGGNNSKLRIRRLLM